MKESFHEDNSMEHLFLSNYKFWENNLLSLIIGKNLQYPWKYDLSSEFDKADKKGDSDEILKAIQVIEPNIEEIKT